MDEQPKPLIDSGLPSPTRPQVLFPANVLQLGFAQCVSPLFPRMHSADDQGAPPRPSGWLPRHRDAPEVQRSRMVVFLSSSYFCVHVNLISRQVHAQAPRRFVSPAHTRRRGRRCSVQVRRASGSPAAGEVPPPGLLLPAAFQQTASARSRRSAWFSQTAFTFM